MEIKKICVLGAGLMGSGIAQVAAEAGYEVAMRDIEDRFVQSGLNYIKKNYERNISKGKMTKEQADGILARVKGLVDLGTAVKGAQVVIEAVVENMDLKKQVYKDLDQLTEKDAILASNTSGLSITEIASVTKKPGKVIGMHFFNPVPVLKLVEVIRAAQTSDETAAAIVALAEELGKTPAQANDSPGFVSNRILMPFLNEAAYALMEGVAEAEAIDTIAKLGFAHPIGPLALADLIGLDTCVSIMEVLREGLGDPKYAPCPLLRQHVAAGRLGRKSGRGFYEYA
jgi:3-hydroxybutyryl-CoA dehydrogenase